MIIDLKAPRVPIDPNEMFAGAIVYNISQGRAMVIERVDQFAYVRPMEMGKTSSYDRVAYYSELIPYPLDDHILTELKFRKNNKGVWMHPEYMEGGLVRVASFEHVFSDWDNRCAFGTINYVHELQHLFLALDNRLLCYD